MVGPKFQERLWHTEFNEVIQGSDVSGVIVARSWAMLILTSQAQTYIFNKSIKRISNNKNQEKSFIQCGHNGKKNEAQQSSSTPKSSSGFLTIRVKFK